MLAPLIQRALRRDDAEDERLLQLYWNRAAVKKELASLRRERYELLERVGEEQAATQRVREQLDALEALLADRDSAATAIVHFQLRHLWRTCAGRLRSFCKDLADKQQRRERERLEQGFARRRAGRLAEAESRLADLQGAVDDTADRLGAARRVVAALPFWRLKRRAGLRREVGRIELELAAQQRELDEHIEARDAIAAEAQPAYPGLSLDSRRLLNIAALAMAQELVVLMGGDDELPRQARAAITSDVRSADFGGPDACKALSRVIDERLDRLAALRNLSARVKLRTDHLRTRVEYRRDDESVPLAHSVSRIALAPDADAPGRMLDINVLADEYWDLHEVLR